MFLTLDNLRVHHSKMVAAWLKENKQKIEVFFLPSYSPERNPDEYLNCDLKAGVHSGPPARDDRAFATQGRLSHAQTAKITRPRPLLFQASENRLCGVTLYSVTGLNSGPNRLPRPARVEQQSPRCTAPCRQRAGH